MGIPERENKEEREKGTFKEIMTKVYHILGGIQIFNISSISVNAGITEIGLWVKRWTQR
jgi:hypothetical protein